MQQDILVNWSPQETRVAIVESGAVQELHVERTLERGLVGNVYLGKVSRVRFAPLTPRQIEAYVDSGEPLGKAGAYAVQGRAAAFIEHREGSYSGIMGLPMYETAQLLRRAGFQI